MERVRIGVIGSQFAARLHLQSLAKLRGVRADVVAVASPNSDHAAACARAFGIPEYYDDYRRLLERGDIDCVDLCMPTDGCGPLPEGAPGNAPGKDSLMIVGNSDESSG